MKHNFALFTAVIILVALPATIVSSPTFAQTTNTHSIKTISLRLLKTVNGWVRVLKTGKQVFLSAQEAYDLGLDPLAAVGHIANVMAIDTYNEASQLVSDIGRASQYIAVDVAMPLLSDGYEYTNGIIIPKSKELIGQGVEYTTNVAIPKAQELASDAYDAAGSAASSAVSGAKSLLKWATD